ncbi:MerR family transcriptional regulator [Streptomyces kronopolitis]|uniref:MerR family transcriptional regulator n=1 Tax=Streptomyces kronopolitis TaxID=1612435 RepID=UPI003D98F24F
MPPFVTRTGEVMGGAQQLAKGRGGARARCRPGGSCAPSIRARSRGSSRSSTLRNWDAEGLVIPGRRPPRGARSHSPAHIRDARIVHQLRTAGYRIDALRTPLPALRRGQRSHDLGAALAARNASVAARCRALLDAARRA